MAQKTFRQGLIMNPETVRKITEIERRLDDLALPEVSSDLVGSLLSLPVLRAVWPMSCSGYQDADLANDISGAGYHLTGNGAGTIRFGNGNLSNGFNTRMLSANSQYLSRADGGATNWADITGANNHTQTNNQGLTLLGWTYFTDPASSTETFGGKWVPGSNNRSYLLQRNATGNMNAIISTNGTTEVSIASDDIVDEATWIFTAMRFDPSTSLDVFINEDHWQNTTSIPATIYDSTAPFTLGATGTPDDFINGFMSLVALSAAYISDAQILEFLQRTRAVFGV